MKAIKIDVLTKTITEINIPKGIAALYQELQCERFATIELTQKDTLYIDDEGLLLEEPLGAFMLKGVAQPLSGHGLILGSDKNGESVDCELTVEQAKHIVTFVDVKLLKGVPIQSTFIPLSDAEFDEYFRTGKLPIGKTPINPQ